MDTLRLSDHTIYVQSPGADAGGTACPAILLNDGELILRHGLTAQRAYLIGIVPNDRLGEYTPWPEKALRIGAPDFGGQLEAYHHCLREEILPTLLKAYPLDARRLAYGGYSLGGLAAALSLWDPLPVQSVFSLCGSFWYPGAAEFMQTHPPKQKGARVFLLNGRREGEGHPNRLQFAAAYAQQVHALLQDALGAESVMDDYQHHDHQADRLRMAIQWAEK